MKNAKAKVDIVEFRRSWSECMPDTSVGVAGIEARQSMIRVWMALSAVWVGFWLLIAAIVLATVEVRYPLSEELGPFSIIVLTPPIALLGVGAALRWAFEMLARVTRPRLSAVSTEATMCRR